LLLWGRRFRLPTNFLYLLMPDHAPPKFF